MQLNIKFASLIALAVTLAAATPVRRGSVDIVDTTLQVVAKRLPEPLLVPKAECIGDGCAHNVNGRAAQNRPCTGVSC
ncbi:hypothetical protein FB45DRAFT_1030853 [Roridomyces roridus]|uniref:Uncharacterized protein n=1 Tax=Roridomyces roridus TaxID=1738132 RepID=A0AAD7FKS7_9AGAR|nr:hypothetical protein FB45DRAFT_1030853 [Roridomyces roridus]